MSSLSVRPCALICYCMQQRKGWFLANRRDSLSQMPGFYMQALLKINIVPWPFKGEIQLYINTLKNAMFAMFNSFCR